MKNIKENLFLVFYNARVLGGWCAIRSSYPAKPDDCSSAMSVSSVSVIGNALRLRNEL